MYRNIKRRQSDTKMAVRQQAWHSSHITVLTYAVSPLGGRLTVGVDPADLHVAADDAALGLQRGAAQADRHEHVLVAGAADREASLRGEAVSLPPAGSEGDVSE